MDSLSRTRLTRATVLFDTSDRLSIFLMTRSLLLELKDRKGLFEITHWALTGIPDVEATTVGFSSGDDVSPNTWAPYKTITWSSLNDQLIPETVNFGRPWRDSQGSRGQPQPGARWVDQLHLV